MSRPIKFRAWDKSSKRYGEVVEIEYNESREISEVWAWYNIHERYEPIPGANAIVEQYTGLKDKNGEEIYEGDIVSLEYYEKSFGKKRWSKTYPPKGGKDVNIVGFEDGYFKFYEEDKDGYGSELYFSDYGEWEGKDGSYKYVAEVIGNIHENPELIGGEE